MGSTVQQRLKGTCSRDVYYRSWGRYRAHLKRSLGKVKAGCRWRKYSKT